MTDPKPISVEYVDPSDYSGPAPQPFAIVGTPAESGPIAVSDVTGLQGILDDFEQRIAGLESAAG